MIDIRIRDRNHNDTLLPPELDYRVQRYSHTARGGPKDAKISTSGSISDLFKLTLLLRYAVELYDDLGETVWWGYINEVRIQTTNVEYTVSLEDMANDVAVTYSTRGAGQGGSSSSGVTAWSEDTESVNTFGRKQKLLSGSSHTAPSATQLRDTALARSKNPIVQPEFRDSDEVTAEIHCVGWWGTLDWNVEYAIPATNEVGPATYTTGQAFADGTTSKVGQTLTISSTASSQIDDADAWVKKVGTPTGNVMAGLYQDSVSSPGAVIVTASVVVGDISVDFVPETFDFSTSSEVSSGTSYWLVLEATGGTTDGSNYFEVGINEDAGYGGGAFYTLVGATWSSQSADMTFTLAGTRVTDTQIEDILDDSDAGQFFTGHKVDATSVYKPAMDSSQDMTALAIVEELLDLGSSNSKRLTVDVTSARRVIIEEELGTDENYYVTTDMSFQNRVGVRIPKAHIHKVVRRWVTPRDLVPILTNTVNEANFANIFVEEIEYDVERDEIQPRARDARALFDLVRLEAK